MKDVLVFDNGWLQAYDSGHQAPRIVYTNTVEASKKTQVETIEALAKAREAFRHHRRASLALETIPNRNVATG